jgi:ADP-heptose:LPS heptosyltransferase
VKQKAGVMSGWPKSKPDYQWPRPLLTPRYAPRRWWGAGLFHLGQAAGRCVSLLRPNRPAALVIRTDGIGDAVLAEPMLASLGRRFADVPLHLWAPPDVCDLFRAAAYVDRRLAVPRGFKAGNLEIFHSGRWRMKLGYRLGRWRFVAAIYLAHSPEPLGNWLLAAVRARRRWYAPGDTENQFAAQRSATAAAANKLFVLEPAAESPVHELSRNACLASQWSGWIKDCLPTVHLDRAAMAASAGQHRCWRQTARWLGAAALVGLMPAASAAVKKYPADAWAAAVAALWQRHRILCALLGSAADEPALREVSLRLGGIAHLKMTQPLDLPAMAGLIGALDGLLSVDTGLAHIALAQEVATVVLVGGSHPGRFFPWPSLPPRRELAVVLNHPMPCQGCRGRCHLSQPQCLTEIEPDRIVQAMAQLLDRRTPLPVRAAG